jgi:cobalt/nickel transport protein
MKTAHKFWIGIAALVLLSPLGIIVPHYLKAGSAWGEWGTEEVRRLTGYLPRGMERLSSLWKAPLPDYAFRAGEEKGLLHSGFAYILSAVTGVVVIVAIVFIIGRFIAKRGK